MTDIVERLVALANSLGGTEEEDIMLGVAEVERLRGVLADIKCGAVNITMAKQMAERALEHKP